MIVSKWAVGDSQWLTITDTWQEIGEEALVAQRMLEEGEKESKITAGGEVGIILRECDN